MVDEMHVGKILVWRLFRQSRGSHAACDALAVESRSLDELSDYTRYSL